MIDVKTSPTQDQITAALMTEIRELRVLVEQLITEIRELRLFVEQRKNNRHG